MDAEARLDAVFAAVGVRGFVHARDLDGGAEIGLRADDPVVLASVFKIPIAVAYARAVAAGRLDPKGRARVEARDRLGGVGTAGNADDVEMSWRDLVRFMLTMSDNGATDVVLRELGVDAVNALLVELGLTRTHLIGGCAEIFDTMTDELDYPRGAIDQLEADLGGLDPDRVWALSALDPQRTTSSTPRELTTLLAALWADEAAPPAESADVRAILGQQIWPHRLSTGFPDGVRVSGKTGTLPSIRNEVGVVEYPDGGRYAVAVFTRVESLAWRSPDVDRAIGTGGALAVATLRG
jgi:beta-lactamase class A